MSPGRLISFSNISLPRLKELGIFKRLHVNPSKFKTEFEFMAWLFMQANSKKALSHFGTLILETTHSAEELKRTQVAKSLNVKAKGPLDPHKIAAHLFHQAGDEGFIGLARLLQEQKITLKDLQQIGVNESIEIKNISSLSNFELALHLLKRTEDLSKFNLIGRMLALEQITSQDLQKVGITPPFGISNKVPLTDLELAAGFFSKAQTPGLFNLASMLKDQKITITNLVKMGITSFPGIPNITNLTSSELAAQIFKICQNLSETCNFANHNLGIMLYQNDISFNYLQKIGATEDLDASAETQLTNFEASELLWEKAETSESLCNLGASYFNGFLGEHLSEEERMKKAEEYFKKSTDPVAKHNLGKLYLKKALNNSQNSTEDFKTAASFFETALSHGITEAGIPLAQINLMLIHLDESEEILTNN